MPLLAAQAELYPDTLFDYPLREHATGRAWWVLHTKPRQEKCLARQLYDAGIAYYLPLIQRRWRVRGRLRSSHIPLFGGYVFFYGDREERLTALSTRRVVSPLAV